MFFKKKKKKEQLVIKEEEFVIPTIDKEIKEILDRKKNFKNTRFVSPHFGGSVKDETIKPDTKGLGDIKKSYDAFRKEEDKMIDKKEIKKQYGTEYFEFDLISNNTRKELFGDDCLIIEDKKNNEDKKTLKEFDEILSSNKVNENKNIEKKIDVFKENIFTNEDVINNTNFVNNKVVENKNIEENIIFFEDEYIEEDLTEEIVEEKVVVNENNDNLFKVVSENEDNLEDYTVVDKKVVFEEPKKFVSKYENYKFPPIELLSVKDLAYDRKEDWIDNQIDIINRTLIEFDVSGHVVAFKKGPTVTRYEIKLDSGVLVKRILNIENNLKMNLSAKTLRIQAPIPGKPNVGIEVPNVKTDVVPFGNLCNDEKFRNSEKKLLVGLGVNIDGENTYTDIAKMPHGLIAGSTGSGKSVCINTILISLLFKNSPDDLKLMLIDPKRVELANYNDLPHLVTPVITDAKIASKGLKWAVDEMERRYTLFAEYRAKDITSYNEKIKNSTSFKKMPYIVIVIDELADLMSACTQDVEEAIQRLAQKARACGIHLLVATQRPTTDVVKGTIKANIPTRLAFRVASYTDSITILDSAGADQLLGYGDCLVKINDNLERIQGAYIPDNEIEKITDYIREHYESDYLFEHHELDKKEVTSSSNNNEENELIYEVGKYVIANKQCSINSITKYFKIGFNRAQRLVEILEEMGVVGNSAGKKSREILISLEEFEEMF